jgi:NAD(P)-dependent dehydrogenase (short-subunit alcohol dehydrogenase family)
MMEKSLEGKGAIITGASRGLGLEISQAFVKAGASVLMCARDGKALENACVLVRDQAQPGQQVVGCPVDVSNPEDVKQMAARALELFPQVHILVNNAGVYGPKGAIETVDWEEWVKAIEINLMGSVLPCRELLPHFKANRYGKIIQLSGGGATAPLPMISAYAASKAAIIRFMETLALEVADFGIDVNAIAPGALNTRLLDEVLDAGPEKVGEAFYKRSLRQKNEGGTPLEKGAALAVYLASAESDGISGKLISAVWDPWPVLQTHRTDLTQTDIYTLRRIVPKDRGKDWGES